MRELVLFRHAKTEPNNAGGDRARELTEAGRQAAVQMAAQLRGEGVSPDLVLVSTAVRTRQTWDLAKSAFPSARTEARDDLYDASADDLSAIVAEASVDAETVMVVGHNPGLQAYAVDLLIEGSGARGDIERVAKSFPTASAAILAIDEAGRASLERLLRPA